MTIQPLSCVVCGTSPTRGGGRALTCSTLCRDEWERGGRWAQRYRTDPEFRQRVASTAVAWQRDNPLKASARRVRRRTVPRFVVTDRDLTRLLARYRNCCAYCTNPLTTEPGPRRLEWDHVVPLILNGAHSVGNLVPACQTCNRSKNRRTLVEWKRLVARQKALETSQP